MKKINMKQKLRYWFDNTMSRGSGALMLWLAILTLIMIVIATFIVLIFGVLPDSEESQSMGLGETFWQTLMRAMDAGTVAGDSGWGFRMLMFLVTLGGIFILSTLIGILSSGIDEKLQELRKGRSFVVEKNHQLILGWNSKVFAIVNELAIANANQKRPRIVVMASEDKTMMEDEIRDKCKNIGKTKVICRSGNPNDINDLSIINLNDTKCIIVLSSESANDADAQVIKVLLAIVNHPTRKQSSFHIVAEIREEKNIFLGQIVAKDEVELLLTDDLVSRIMVQTCRQSGLSIVYTEITGFDSDEIYIVEQPSLNGYSFGDVLFKCEDSSVIGIQFPDGRIKLNPPMDLTVEEGMKFVVLTEDDDTFILNAQHPTIAEQFIVFAEDEEQVIEKTLILSWNRKGPSIIREMSSYVTAGSELLIVSKHESLEEDTTNIALSGNMLVKTLHADPSDRNVLAQLNVTEFTQIIVLSNSEKLDSQDADSKTLMTLLYLRDFLGNNENNVRIVSEIMDARNRELASITRADDFVVSEKLIAQMLTQVSESKELVKVFNDMFDSEGSEIYLKPMNNYIQSDKEVNYFTVVESAKRQNQIAIGYRVSADQYNKNKSYGIVLNPPKSSVISFSSDDKIIVFAED
jgi:ion channel POLLUX/CASTOR